MEAQVDDHCITMDDLGPPVPKLPADLRCSQITSIGKELEIYQIRRDYVTSMIDLENRTPSATTETKSKLRRSSRRSTKTSLSWKVSWLTIYLAQMPSVIIILKIKRSKEPQNR
ncbi:hypothetical protein TNCV_3969611 [Trichonephila clavipes]|nr:hypothetical protein TNCV_3969611 [Trichonephila clavipes]